MDLREQVCDFGLSLYNRGFTHGSTGNLSVRLPDGNILVTPTGSSLGRLTPEGLSVIKPNGELVSGPKPTKRGSAPPSSVFDSRRSCWCSCSSA